MLPRGGADSAMWTAQAEWHKSRHSNPDGNCVELAVLDSGQIAMRNSRHANGPILVCTHAEIRALIQSARDGDFDALLA
jgi:hypothetical protein